MHTQTLRKPKVEQAETNAGFPFRWRGWALVVTAALALAVVSWLTNITTMAQISGEADGFLAFRFTFSKLVNSGTAWAGLAILCGWLVRRPLQAAAAGILGTLLALSAHYAMGWMSGMFDAADVSNNSYWFVTGVVAGAVVLSNARHRHLAVQAVARAELPEAELRS